MSNWRQSLRKPSFRGVEFHVQSSSIEVQKNQQANSVPFKIGSNNSRNISTSERTFSLTCFVSGNDYNIQRDRLISALEDDKKGELIHPHFGSIQVVCKSFTVNEDFTTGGTATFNIAFTKVGNDTFLTVKKNQKKKIQELTKKITQKAQKDFEKSYSTKGLSPRMQEGLADKLSKIYNNVNEVSKRIKKQTQKALMAAYRVKAAANKVKEIINAPSALAANLAATYDTIEAIAEREKLYFLESLIAQNSSSIDNKIEIDSDNEYVNTKQSATILNNIKSTKLFLSLAIEMNISNELIKEPENLPEGISLKKWERARNNSVKRLKTLLEDASDDLFNDLQSLRYELNTLKISIDKIQDKKTFPVRSENALTFSYRVAGNALYADEISISNTIQDPRFLSEEKEIVT